MGSSIIENKHFTSTRRKSEETHELDKAAAPTCSSMCHFRSATHHCYRFLWLISIHKRANRDPFGIVYRWRRPAFCSFIETLQVRTLSAWSIRSFSGTLKRSSNPFPLNTWRPCAKEPLVREHRSTR